MTNSDDRPKAGKPPAKASKSADRKARAAQALRENLKKRKQQIKAREDSSS